MKEEQISERQLEIIKATGKILMSKGIKGLTTKNLALEIGFTEGALYKHFKKKEDILEMLLSYLAQNMKDRLEPLAKSDKTAIEKLDDVFYSQFEYFKENPHFIVAILSEGLFDDTDKINQVILKIMATKYEFISKIIEEGRSNQIITKDVSTQDITHIMMGSFRLVMLKYKFSKYTLNLPEEGSQIMNSTLKLITT